MRLEFHELEVCSMEMMLSISLPDIFKQMETSTFEEVNLSLPLTSFLVAQKVKRLLTVWETWFQSLGWEDPLEKEMATHSSALAWKIPWTEEHGGLQSTGSQRVGHD